MLQLLIAPLVKQQEQTSTTYICYSFDCPFGKTTGTDFYYIHILQLLIAPLVKQQE
jgi:hypothetical protein